MPIGTIIAEFFSGIADAWRARRALKAQADLQAGADILNKAIREDTEMRAAAEAMEARKRLDSTLSSTSIVPALPTIQPGAVPASAQPGTQPVPAPSPAPAQPVQPAAAAPVAATPSAPAPPAAPAAPTASAPSASPGNVN